MWLLDGLAGADLIEPLVQSAVAALPLVAQDRDG
jgi:hypothetical protein